MTEDRTLRSIMQASPDTVVLTDCEGKILFINRVAPGFERDQVIGAKVFDFAPAAQHQAMKECFARVVATGEPDRYENLLEFGGASTEWESRVGPVMEGGKLVGFSIFASDVTERRAAALDRDRVFNLSLDMLCVADLDGYFRRVNPAFERTLGFSAEELEGKRFIDWVHPEDKKKTLEAMSQLGEGQDVLDFTNRYRTNRYRTKDGTYRVLSWHSRVDVGSQRIHAVARDVTDQLALEEQLRQSQKMDALGQLAGGVAHDFNNLVLAIRGNVELAEGRAQGDPELAARLQQIEKAADRAASLTRQLLSFSRRQPINPKEVELNTLIRDIMRLIERLIPENIEFEFIPGTSVPKIRADAGQIEQTVMNLCLNARDAMPEGGVLRLVTDQLRAQDGRVGGHAGATAELYARITISDSGEGMSQEVLEHVFEPFFTTKAPGKGTGLGLATVYGIVRQHDGFIQMESEPGRGTRVEMLFPEGQEADRKPRRRESLPPQGGKEVILLAEDEPLVRTVVVQMLEAAGYEVLVAVDGRQAVRIFEAHMDRISLALLDVVMPEMSGPQAFLKMRELRPDLRALFSSGYNNETQHIEALPEGSTLLPKPYRRKDLVARVRQALDEE